MLRNLWKYMLFVVTMVGVTHGNKEIVISMSQSTLQGLKAQGFILYALQGVSSSINDVKMTVWIKNTNYLTENYITWNELQYKPYITEPKSPGDYPQMSSYNSIAASPGQIVTIDKDGHGTLSIDGTVPSGGDAAVHVSTSSPSASTTNSKSNSYFINNLSTASFIVGLAVSSTPTKVGLKGHMHQRDFAICSIPLNGKSLVEIRPTQKVLLVFATEQHQVGDAVLTLITASYAIDMLNVKSSVHVTYDIDNGWILHACDMPQVEGTVISPQQMLHNIIGTTK